MAPQLPTNEPNTLRERISAQWALFSNFALRDNVLEIAVGLIIASAFSSVVNSFVSDLLLPIVSLLPFLNKNFDQMFLILRGGKSHTHGHVHYNTLQQALDDGAVVWAWGSFVDKVVRFFLIAGSLFVVGKVYQVVSGDRVIKPQVKCQFCRKWISQKAKRCVNCTSWQDGRHEQ